MFVMSHVVSLCHCAAGRLVSVAYTALSLLRCTWTWASVSALLIPIFPIDFGSSKCSQESRLVMIFQPRLAGSTPLRSRGPSQLSQEAQAVAGALPGEHPLAA